MTSNKKKINQTNLISIITPVYNSSRFITEVINSVLSQTYKNWEMIIVDDQSIDDSVDIIKDVIKNDSRFKVIELKCNVGAAQCRNAALNEMSGRFVAFLDSDDIWYPSKLEKQISFMLRKDAAISFTSYELINECGEGKNQIINAVKELDQIGYLKNTIIGFSTSMIDTKIIGNEFRFLNIRTRQDTSLWITLLGKGFLAYGIPTVLTKYRIHSESISKNKYKAAKQVFNLYFNIHQLGFFKSMYYFIFYAFNACKKRL